MLTLAGALHLGRCTVYRDRPDAGAAYTNRFYVLPDSPRLAMDADGEPEFDFVWYRGPAGTRGAGGLVMITTELGLTAVERAELADALRVALPTESLDAIELHTVPFLDGTVSLALAGAVVATVPARLQGTERATFSVELDADDAALVAQLIGTGEELFHATYALRFAYRLDGVSLRVWCDGGRAHDLAGALDPPLPDRVRAALVDEHAAGVELVTEQPLTLDYRSTLDGLGQTLLTAALTDALHRPGVTSFNQTFTTSTLLPQPAVASDVIRLDRTVAELGDRVRTVDLTGGFFATLDIQVLCTVDFGRELIDVVHLIVSYDATGPDGRVQRSREMIFRAGVGPQHFRIDLAAPDQRSVSWRTAVYYRGDPQPVIIDQPPTPTNLIILDLDGTGVLEVSAAVRDPSWTSVSAATVELEHPATGHAARLVLDAAHPDATWTAVVRQRPGRLRYRVSWHPVAGVDEIQDWVETTAYALVLDPPRELVPRTAVELMAAGDFSGLAQLLVELRTEPGVDPVPFTFTEPGQSSTWSAAGLDARALRYQSRQTLIYADGTRTPLGWADQDAPLLVVGDLLRFPVLIEPRMLDLGGAYRLALLQLETGAETGATLVLRDRSEQQHWSFRMPAPNQSDYRYRLTLVQPDGVRVVGAWQSTRTGILVLRPELSPSSEVDDHAHL